VSNYRVRQALALGVKQQRQKDFLVALATFMTDDSRRAVAGVNALMKVACQSRNTFRAARRELEESGSISSIVSGKGPKSLTTWTVHCLPAYGVNVLDPITDGVNDSDPIQAADGVNPGPLMGSTEPSGWGQAQLADLQEPDRGLNRRAKPSSSLSRALADLATAVPTLTEREIESISDRLNGNPEIPHPGPYLQAVIGNGDAATFAAAVLNGHDRRGRHGRQAETDQLFDDAMARARARSAAEDGPRSEACKRNGHRDCGYSWCTCTCHGDAPRERLDDAQPLAAIAGAVLEHHDERRPSP
jgi:hypothetical protein